MPGPLSSCPRCWRCYRKANRRASFSRLPGWRGYLLMSAHKSLHMISPTSAPWQLTPTASGRQELLRCLWPLFPSTTSRRGLRRLWTLVPGLHLELPHRPPPVRPGSPAASAAHSVSTIGSGVLLPATVGTPVPGKAGGREMCRPPVGYRTPIRRRRAHPPPGLYFWSSFPGGHGILPQCFPPSVLSTAFGPSTHHRRRHPCAGLGSP